MPTRLASRPKGKLKRHEFLSILWAYMAKDRWYDAARILWPWFVDNPQSKLIFDHLTHHRESYLLGHGSGTKTLSAVGYAFLRWLWRPLETTVLICGPTLKSLQSRAWAYQTKMATQAKIPLYCDVLQSRHLIRFHDYAAPAENPDKPLKSEEGRIECVDGSTEGKDHRIRGLHTPLNIIIIDEGDSNNLRAVWDAIPNLESSGEFMLIAMTNPTDRNTPMGKRNEPVQGWGSVDIESDFSWPTKGGGSVLRLDALRSPNVLLGFKKYEFLPDSTWVEKIRERDGENSVPWFSQVRAWYPPEGMVNYIFNVQILERMWSNQALFYADTIPVAACDPAFEEGGDRCVWGWGEAGRDAADPRKLLLRINNMAILKRSSPMKLASEDFGDQAITLCQTHGVKPRHFCGDTTGNGLAFMDYVRFKWSREAMPVGFGGKPSETKILDQDTKKANERFDRFVTELWWAGRDWARAGHILIHPDCAYQEDLKLDLESRRYVQLPHEKVEAETKLDMKERGLQSPDFGDFFNLLVHVVRVRVMQYLPNVSGPKISKSEGEKSYWAKFRAREKPPEVGLAASRNPRYRRRTS